MRRGILAVVAGALLAAGCTALGGGEQASQVQSDIQRLDRQVRNLQQAQSLGNDAARRLEQLEGGLNQVRQQMQALQQNQASLTARYQALERDQQSLTGRFEEAKHLTDRVRQDQEQVQKTSSAIAALDNRLRQLEQELSGLRQRVTQAEPQRGVAPQPPAQPGATSPQATQPRPAPTAAAAPTPQQAEAIYREGFDFMNRGEYARARDRFQAFLKAAPSSEFAEGAVYAIAETYYREKDYENAILKYEELVARFPKGRRVPAALLYQGLAFKELGAPKDARALLEKVVQAYPNSTEATLARVELPKLPQ
jgi:tol-pal system protein YbgF